MIDVIDTVEDVALKGNPAAGREEIQARKDPPRNEEKLGLPRRRRARGAPAGRPRPAGGRPGR